MEDLHWCKPEELKQAWVMDLKKTVSKSLAPAPLSNSSFYVMMKPLLMLVRIFGRLPYKINKNDRMETRFFSFCTFYCITLFVGLSYFATTNALAIIQFIMEENDFLNVVLGLLNLIIMIFHSSLPIAVYFESERISKFFNDWADYEVHIGQITGKRYKTKYNIWLRGCLLVCPLIITGITIYEQNILYNVKWYHLIIFVNMFVLAHLNMFFWIFTLAEIGNGAAVLNVELKETVSKRYNAVKIYNYRIAWLKLRKLLESAGNCVPITMVTLTSVNHCCFVISAYVLISRIINGNIQAIQFLGVMALTGVMVVSTLEAGQRCSTKVGKDIVDTLMETDISHLDNDGLREMNHFIHAVSNSCTDVTLGGFITINRSTLAGIFGSTVTYLIVLVQLNQSPEQSDL